MEGVFAPFEGLQRGTGLGDLVGRPEHIAQLGQRSCEVFDLGQELIDEGAHALQEGLGALGHRIEHGGQGIECVRDGVGGRRLREELRDLVNDAAERTRC